MKWTNKMFRFQFKKVSQLSRLSQILIFQQWKYRREIAFVRNTEVLIWCLSTLLSIIFLHISERKLWQLDDWQSGWDRQWGIRDSCYHTLQMFRMCVKLSWACYPYWPESHSVNSSGTIFVLFKFSIFTFLDWSISLEMHLTDRPSSSLLSFSCIYLTLEQVKILQHIIYQRQLLEVSSLVLIRLSPKYFSL